MRIHEERELDILSLTINNVCNLECPHCYLNVAGKGTASEKVIDKIFEEPPAKIAIVGMEPLHDPRSAAIVRDIARRGKATETFVSMVTNGLGLKFLRGVPHEELPDLIDISLDGGPESYKRFRGNGKDLFPLIKEGAERFRAEYPDIPVNVLHTLFAENTTPETIADMVEGGRLVSSSKGDILFSPYVPPMIQIGQRRTLASGLGIRRMLETLEETPEFMGERRAEFFAGPYNAESFGLSIKQFLTIIASVGLRSESRIDTAIPHLNGGLRVTYDGYALRPDYSIHTSLYEKYRVPIEGRRLVDIYNGFQTLPSTREVLP